MQLLPDDQKIVKLKAASWVTFSFCIYIYIQKEKVTQLSVWRKSSTAIIQECCEQHPT